MIKFTEYLIENVPEVERLSHLEHAEDHAINAGHAGVHHAVRTMVGVHHALLGHNTPVKLTTKYDGAPSIVFGTHPETKKFFVASKSAFNKTPKINYSHEDVDRHHGHAPGLASKLKTALDHLPKVTPHGKIYQGDLMHTEDMRSEKGGKIHFKPNTIQYSVKKNSPEGHKVAASKVGVAVHTEYKGSSHDTLKAHFGPDTSNFKSHPDVHIIHAHTDVNKADYKPADRVKFFSHINKAKEAASGHDFSHLDNSDHQMHVKTYINHTVRTGTSPTVQGLEKHVLLKHEAMKSKVKMEKTKQGIESKAQGQLSHINKHRDSISRTFEIHKHLQDAKHTLVKSLASSDHFDHHINGKKTGPEGHVAFLGGKPTKLVDRSEGGFSSANLVAGGISKLKKTK